MNILELELREKSIAGEYEVELLLPSPKSPPIIESFSITYDDNKI